MFTDKLTLAIAEAAKKCMDEELVGNQHKIDANKNGKVDAHDFKLLRKEEQMSNPGLETLASKLRAARTGKPSNPALEKLAHEKAKAKYLNKEETVNEEEGQNGYVAFSHDGRKADIHANSSYEAHRKAIKHFDAPKAKHHMVVVKLAQKSGKDVVHTATESVQEAAIDDLRDRQAAKREANPYVPTAKKEDPAKRVVQGNQYGGAKQKDEKEVDEAVESTNQHYVVAHNRARGVSSIVKKDGEHHLHPSKEAASEHAGKLNAKSSSPHVYYTYGGNINEDMEDLNESKAHIEQHLADRDINSKVTGKVVKVHSSDVSSTKKHIQKAGYKDHTVVGGLNEEKMSDEDMNQREKIVKGMKKNLQGFKARYGDRAKDVMYATATKQAMKEGAVPSTEKTVTVKHKTSGKEMVVTANSAAKYKSLGYHPVKEEAEQIIEREESPTKGTRKIASYGDHAHTAEVRYNPEYQEYQVHHYKAGKHQGEGPVSYHYDDKADAHSTAKHSVGIKESLTEEHMVHVDTGAKYDSEPHPKDVEHVRSGIDKHGATFAGNTDKGIVFKFKNAQSAIDFKNHTNKSPHRSMHADLTESVQIDEISSEKLAKEEVEQIDEAKEHTFHTYGHAVKKLVDKYAKHNVSDTSHGIGGNFHAQSSGKIEYAPQHQYSASFGPETVHHAVKIGSSYPKDKAKAFEKEHDKIKVPSGVNVQHGENDVRPHHLHKHDEYGGNFSTRGLTIGGENYHVHKEEVEELDEASIKLFMGKYQVWHKGNKVASYNSKTDAQDHANSLKEEVEQIDELSKGTLGSYVKKAALSQHYDNKNFKSKEANNKDTQSDEEKREGVKKSSKRTMGVMNAINRLTKEEVEQIDELSKGTLGSYVKKASVDIGERGLSTNAHFDSKHLSNLKKMSSRVKNINKAVDKLAIEEVEELDEVSKELLGRYVKRASRDGAHKSALAQAYSQNFDKSIDMNRIAIKRKKGIDKAVDKLTKEEVDSDTFNSELADNKAKAAGTKKQPDIAKASVQAVKQESFSSKLTALKEGVRSYLKDRNNG